jgi:hypothetical protein
VVSALEIAEIEAGARALRAATLAGLLSRAWTWLSAYYEQTRRRREREHLARSQSRPEMASRLRKLERQGHSAHM